MVLPRFTSFRIGVLASGIAIVIVGDSTVDQEEAVVGAFELVRVLVAGTHHGGENVRFAFDAEGEDVGVADLLSVDLDDSQILRVGFVPGSHLEPAKGAVA